MASSETPQEPRVTSAFQYMHDLAAAREAVLLDVRDIPVVWINDLATALVSPYKVTAPRPLTPIVI